ncbi:MAG: V-type ATP synthase subunit K [Tissierellia bacterium]|nr:V-type ATP synthase subunit K [Tissierellia bacterium]
MAELMNSYGGLFFGVLGVAIAVLFAGIGSANGVGIAGQGSAGIVAEEPEKFVQALILQLLPGTQGLYGFVIGLLIIFRLSVDTSLLEGLYLMVSAMPIGFVGWRSGIAQGKVSAAGMNILAKDPSQSVKGIILAVMVETYAILAFAISFILLNQITF